MGRNAGGGGRGLSASQRRGVFGTLTQGRSVTVQNSRAFIRIENAPPGLRTGGRQFTASVAGVTDNPRNRPARRLFDAAGLNRFLRDPDIRLVSRLR